MIIKQKNAININSVLSLHYKDQKNQHSNMQISNYQNCYSTKRILSLSKTFQNILILNISQIKPIKKQINKEENGLKTLKKNSQSNRQVKSKNKKIRTEKQQVCKKMKEEEEDYNIKAIEQHIFGRLSKDIRKKYVYNIYRGAIYSCYKLKSPPYQFVKTKSIYLNEATVSHKKFLLLDLDQTLIHTTKEETCSNNKRAYKFLYRPHLFTFLEKMSQCYQIYAFTAAQKSYAQAVVNKLNRSKVYIKDILHREHCLQTKKGIYIKDLRIIQNRPLEHLVIVDNFVESFGLQIDNGVPILQFSGNEEDKQLLMIIPFLEKLSQVEDVRTVLKQRYKLKEIANLKRQQVQEYFISG